MMRGMTKVRTRAEPPDLDDIMHEGVGLTDSLVLLLEPADVVRFGATTSSPGKARCGREVWWNAPAAPLAVNRLRAPGDGDHLFR